MTIAMIITITIVPKEMSNFLYDKRSMYLKIKSKIIARSAAGIAPIKMSALLLRSMPNNIKSPRPPAPIKAASVAVPMINTIAVRIPAMMTGIAIGSSTLVNLLSGFIPMPLAASIREGSTSLIPVYVLRRIGSNAYTTKAIIAGSLPIPKIGIIKPSSASDGIVCRTAAIFMTISESFFVLVSKIAIGTAIRVAMKSAIKES